MRNKELTKDETKIIVDLLKRKIMGITIDIASIYGNDDKFESRKELVSLKRILKKIEN